MRRVYICSPLGGNVSANIENAKRYARYALECGMAPFIPHFALHEQERALCLNYRAYHRRGK